VPYSSSLARPSDPETSSAAATAAEADGLIDTHEWRILQVLREMPKGGTGTEIAEAVRSRWGVRREIDFCKHTVCRRFAGLLSSSRIHRRVDGAATAKAKANYERRKARGLRVGRRPGPVYLRRGGETIHYFGAGDFPLCPEL